MALLAWLLAGVVAWAALRTWTGQQLDESALQEADGVVDVRALPWLSSALDVVPIATMLLVGLAILTLLLRTRRPLTAAVVIVVAALSLVSVQLLKLVVLSKPDLGIQEATLNSFPSGHASLAAVAGLVWVLAVPVRARGWVALLGAGITSAVGTLTVVVGWHRPADVVAAILITSGWVTIGALLLRSTLGAAPARGPLALGITKIGLGLLALNAATTLGVTQTSGAPMTLVAGVLAITATALLAFAGIAAVARHR